ncbi:MAG: glycosyltransferase family 4 protein [Gemmatales bacterium]
MTQIEQARPCNIIRVGLTEGHGMASEASQFPPYGVEYSFLIPKQSRSCWIRSPIKGFMRDYEYENQDLIEAILSPIRTDRRWILSLSNFMEAVAFSFKAIPLPLALRVAYIKSLLVKENCKKIYFWSQAGRDTLLNYGKLTDRRVLNKVDVVYPAIRKAPEELIRFHDDVQHVNLLFTGYFFRKGGVNVIDAFERAQKIYPNIKLRLCCGETIDFVTPNNALKEEYLKRIHGNPNILMARATRNELVQEILPNTDVFLVPTYVETFGFAILEAMAYGLPIISTTHFAIPEMIEHNVNGLLIDTSKYDCESLFRGYVVNRIPMDFREYVTEMLFTYMCQLIESAQLRKRLGISAMQTARTKFSFESRNAKMLAIYQEALK